MTPPFWPCDCDPRSQVKSPSSKNSHPSSLTSGCWAGHRARQALWETAHELGMRLRLLAPTLLPTQLSSSTQVGGAREHFWDARRGFWASPPSPPLHLARRPLLLPSPEARAKSPARRTQLATWCIRTAGPWTVPGRAGVPPAELLKQVSGELADPATRGEHGH